MMDWWKKKKKKRLERGRKRGATLLEDLIECCDGKSNPIKFFSEDQIREATDNFCKSDYVFSDKYGYDWYSCKNENPHIILIGRCKYEGESFCRDIAISSMVSGHKNFLKLVGCCLESKYPAIVYHGAKRHYKLDLKEQTWEKRMKIAEDIATVLAYLHTAFSRSFVYRNMCLENILLDEDGVAKLIGFSGCISIPEGETFVEVRRIVGVYGYMDQDYMYHGIVSEKTDAFGIGILMQQLLIGKEKFQALQEERIGFDIRGKDVQEAGESKGDWDTDKFRSWLSKYVVEGRIGEIADPKIIEEMSGISEEELCQMKAFITLSERCVGKRGEVPTMVEVAKELKKIQKSL